jgi:hypothetical protein
VKNRVWREFKRHAEFAFGQRVKSSLTSITDMLLVAISFWALLLLCCSFAAVAGGTSGKIGAAMLILSTVTTSLIEPYSGWSQTHIPVMVIDLILLAGLYTLAMNSRAYWPIWATGFHSLTVTGHFATIVMPDFRLGIYLRFSGIWSLLVLMSMVIGVSMDLTRRRRGKPAP